MSLRHLSEQRKVLSTFFSKLASGDDVTELIVMLRNVMQSHKVREARVESEHDKAVSHTNNDNQANNQSLSIDIKNTNSINERSLSVTGNCILRSCPGATWCGKAERSTTNANYVINKNSSSTCSELETCESSALTHEYRKATKMAFLFAVESYTAMEEATHLYYSPSTWTCTRWHDNRVLSLGRNELCTVLSDRAAVKIAREIMEKTHNWWHALRILSNVEQTPITRSAGIEICSDALLWLCALSLLYGDDVKSIYNKLSKTCEKEMRLLYGDNKRNDCHSWASKLSKFMCNNTQVFNLESALAEEHVNHTQAEKWEEIDVVRVIRACYHAVLHLCKASSAESNLRYNEEEFDADEIHEELLCVPKPDECSTEARMFYTLPLRLIYEAVTIHSVQFTTVSAINDALGLLSLSTLYAEDGCMLLRLLLTCASNTSCLTELKQVNTEVAQNATHEKEYSNDNVTEPIQVTALVDHSLFPLVKANAITVYHTCNLLYSERHKALFYIDALLSKYNIAVECDDAACASYLRLCLQEENIDSTIKIVEKRLRLWDNESNENKSSTHSSLPFPSDLFIALVALFAKHSQCANVQNILNILFHLDYVGVCNNSCNIENGMSFLCQRQLQQQLQEKKMEKYCVIRAYNTNTLSRAYNTLLQHAKSIEVAWLYLSKLEEINTNNKNTKMVVEMENESLIHLSELYAEKGDWKTALKFITEIMETPERDKFFFPSAKLHDTLQMVLEQSEAQNAPSYKESVKLFNMMCERNVPLSEIAFHCVVKQCFKQGAVDEAQNLLIEMIRHGVK